MIRVIIPLLANPGKLIQILFLTVFRVVNQSLIITPISGKLIHKREFRRRIFGKLIQAIHQIWMAFSRNQSRPENWILEKISSFFRNPSEYPENWNFGKILSFPNWMSFPKLDEFPKIGWVFLKLVDSLSGTLKFWKNILMSFPGFANKGQKWLFQNDLTWSKDGYLAGLKS